ncbi:pyridoxal phosphate-dependent aminotransferase [Roseburia hominis]|uniref:pyridoxal phosphate-dependent aminotransferase n=1 Tax=Roseburia hominis TaxID=301301 RepID=UPI0026EC35AE|nr:histidinol-phosphate transaminase [Roseburia hominis]MCI7524297.1 histidinol-phosphate aminotransferase family protein [Roseburia hominis]
MKNVTALLRDSMKVKPASKRGARQKTSTPKGVTRLNYNENNYGPAPEVTKLLIDSIGRVNEYQDFFAIDLKQKIADFYGLDKTAEAASETNEFGEVSKPEDYVIIGAGSSAVIDMLGEIFINPGDEVVYCMPSYESFPDMVNDYGGKRVEIPLTADYHFDLDGMYEAVTEKTKLVVVVNPNNPTGTYINGAKIEEFIRKVHEKAVRLHPDDDQDVVVIVDEAYYEYVDDPTHYSMIEMVQKGYDRPLIVQRTFSKAYGLAGLRIGYAITQPALADAIMKACQAWNYSGPGLLACEAALDYQDYIKKVKALNIENRNYVAEELKQLGFEVVPPAANFIFFGIPDDATAEQREKMDPVRVKNELAERKIMIGAPNGHNRVSIGTAEECKVFIAAMKEIVR